jgi:hypothetical protein
MADFYAPLGAELSQGDIVAAIPWGLIDDPLTVCRAEDRSKPEGKARYAPVAALRPPPKGVEIIHARAQIGMGMVLWHDCQIDKFKNQGKPETKWFASIAPVVPLQDSDPDAAAAVREGRRRAFFFLPAFAAIGIEKDSYVDLRHIWPLRRSLLSDRRGALSLEARNDLYAHLFTFLTQTVYPHEVRCIHCARQTPWEYPVPVGDD